MISFVAEALRGIEPLQMLGEVCRWQDRRLEAATGHVDPGDPGRGGLRRVGRG